jgi:chlorobactene glucosyltransferase
MVNILFVFALVILAGFSLITIINILFGPHLKRSGRPVYFPEVSILIPARNEEETIGRCLDSLVNQDYPNYKIQVLNDNSSDRTGDIISDYSNRYEQITYLNGKPLPDKWLGKNWACWQLSEEAKGDVFLFVDADTWHKKSAVSDTIYWMEKYNLSLISAFPQQITYSFAEKIIVPLIDIILYMLLPLWATYKISSSKLAAANGQWLAIRKTDYRKIGGHQQLKSRVVEDVEMARLSKKNDQKVMTVSGTGVVFCRMYNHFRAIWSGLSKNFYGLTGNNVILLVSLLLILSIAFILPYISILFYPTNLFPWVLVLLMIFLRVILAVNFHHHLIVSIIFLPATIIFGMIISMNSLYQSKYGSVFWKGRSIKLH